MDNKILVLVDIQTDVVLNVIVATDDYQPPAGLRAVEAPGAQIGWLWNDGVQSLPAPDTEPAPEGGV